MTYRKATIRSFAPPDEPLLFMKPPSAIIGSMVRTVPGNCVPVNYGGMVYQQCGSTWYQPQGPQYIVVNQPY